MVFQAQWCSLKSFFVLAKANYTVIIKHIHNDIVNILIYVDDQVITGSNLKVIQSTKLFFSTQFLMKDMGPIRYFLGLEVDHTPQGFFLSQKKYISNLLDDYYMKDWYTFLSLDWYLKLTTTTSVPL